jgi:hypothetical protein
MVASQRFLKATEDIALTAAQWQKLRALVPLPKNAQIKIESAVAEYRWSKNSHRTADETKKRLRNVAAAGKAMSKAIRALGESELKEILRVRIGQMGLAGQLPELSSTASAPTPDFSKPHPYQELLEWCAVVVGPLEAIEHELEKQIEGLAGLSDDTVRTVTLAAQFKRSDPKHPEIQWLRTLVQRLNALLLDSGHGGVKNSNRVQQFVIEVCAIANPRIGSRSVAAAITFVRNSEQISKQTTLSQKVLANS